MNTRVLTIVGLICIVAGSMPGAGLAALFTGSIAAPVASGIDTTGGAWLNSPSVTISWRVSDNPDGSWHYSYAFTTPQQGGLSHMIIELSNGITSQDIFNLVGGGLIDTYNATSQGNSNPGMPGTIYGIKTEATTFSFDIFRAPTWGDFYAKNGNAGGGQNAAWNTGLIAGEAAGLGNDPEHIAPHNGPDTTGGFHILVPDTVPTNTPIPEPATLAIWGLGLGIAGVIGKRRIRQN